MAVKSITTRWLVNSLSLIVIILLLIAIITSLAIQNYYYSSARQILSSAATSGSDYILRVAQDSNANFNTELRSLVENFEDKNAMEVMAINHYGSIAVTSSGFTNITVIDDLDDYYEALNSTTGTGYYIGNLSTTGEKIMAISIVLPVINGDYSAIRYVISLDEVDNVILGITLGIFGAIILILLLILISNTFFIKSIVLPVRDIASVATKFSEGDMSARIIKNSDDEIGDLCLAINLMADEIQKSEKIKNEFISSVSHELRTPLTAIKGWGETLVTMGEGDIGMVKKGMHVIMTETQRLSDMVEELLDFSRMQNGKFTLTKTKIDILAELGDAVLIYTERAKRDNKMLLYHEPAMVSSVFGDKNRLKQVFINIIDNALKYSDPGDTVQINVREDEDFINIVVSDTGLGIAQDDLSKVKEKFYKANSTRRGSGIGLAVANEIVLMHDGEITIASTIDVGTTVTVRLPLMQ